MRTRSTNSPTPSRKKLGPLDDVNNSFSKLGRSLAPLAPIANVAFGAVKIVATAAAGATAAIAGIGVAVGKATQMETLETAFVPLLGGIDQAKARMKDLSQFAASTPFEIPEVGKASTVLETLTKGALYTGEGLRMVGDVASRVLANPSTRLPSMSGGSTTACKTDGLWARPSCA